MAVVSSTNKPDLHDITKILLKVALNTITPSSLIIKYGRIYKISHFQIAGCPTRLEDTGFIICEQ
jgi:hypothetical protein